MLVDVIVFARFKRDLLDDFPNKIRQHNATRIFETIRPRFLARDLDGYRKFFRVVRRDLGTDAILERRDDLAARQSWPLRH